MCGPVSWAQPRRPLQVDKNVEREVLNHRRLSGHTNIVQFKEASALACCLPAPCEACSDVSQ